jgi:hypothetical protein
MAIDTPYEQAIELSEQIKKALAKLSNIGTADGPPLPAEPTDDELLQFPFDTIKIDNSLESLPPRKSSRHELAAIIAILLHPVPEGGNELYSIIRYEADRVRICRWIRLSRQYDILVRTLEHEKTDWRRHIEQQGPWEPKKQPISLTGPPSLPMPVEIATAESLKPFFTHISTGGEIRSHTPYKIV